MSRTRTFVAVSISPDVINRIKEIVLELSRGVEGVKWVAPENLHFTLKFLGDVEDSDLHDVCSAVAEATTGLAPFEVLLAGAGAFPSPSRPRTVWIGAGQGEEEFVGLYEAVDRALRKVGFRSETRKFTPHVTVGRIRKGNPTLSQLTEHLKSHAATELGTVPVDEVLVFSSELRPGGPEYHVLGRAPLGK
jgi:RNA 2',3'-cyclic 3'-phosphodiesterase